ncbi:hypothetical protein AB0O91_00920 [Kitasatospora sp. NPDC089797]|uniref:hypothetical protein n=1 Tax=Kitasatospora sp. NPDC089797 TaxID=3155298 RepID=UPI00343A9C35
MTITKKTVAVISTTAAIAGATILGAGAATAEPRAVEFTRTIQNVYYNQNLDYRNTPQVKTQLPGGDFQNWTFKLVGQTADGTGIYTIRWGEVSCITNLGLDKDVITNACDDLNLAQRWIVETTSGQTTIASQKSPNQVLQANGNDEVVTTTPVFGDPSPKQLWTLYKP